MPNTKLYHHVHCTHTCCRTTVYRSSSQDLPFVFGRKDHFSFSSVVPSFNVSFAGKISLDNVFQERERLNHNIVGEEVFEMDSNLF